MSVQATTSKKLEVLHTTLGNIRGEIEKKKAAIAELEDGVVPLEEALETVNTTVDLLASSLHETGSDLSDPTFRGLALPLTGTAQSFGEAAATNSVAALLCRMFPERFKEVWIDDVRGYYEASGGVTHDPKKIAKLRAEVHALEVQEERLICEADELGIEIPRRRGVDPAVVLGL